MAMTTPRTRPESDASVEGSGYGSLDRARQSRPGRALRWSLLAAVVVAVLGAGAWLLRPGSEADSSYATTAPTTSATTTASTPTTAASVGTTTVPEPPAGWAIGGELVDYVDQPLFSEPGTPEAGVEIAFVNSEIATSRALANPSFEEDELAVWQTGVALAGTRDSMRVLVERGQVLLTGPLSRLEVEKITFLRGCRGSLSLSGACGCFR